jgi:hypothetical protein
MLCEEDILHGGFTICGKVRHATRSSRFHPLHPYAGVVMPFLCCLLAVKFDRDSSPRSPGLSAPFGRETSTAAGTQDLSNIINFTGASPAQSFRVSCVGRVAMFAPCLPPHLGVVPRSKLGLLQDCRPLLQGAASMHWLSAGSDIGDTWSLTRVTTMHPDVLAFNGTNLFDVSRDEGAALRCTTEAIQTYLPNGTNVGSLDAGAVLASRSAVVGAGTGFVNFQREGLLQAMVEPQRALGP